MTLAQQLSGCRRFVGLSWIAAVIIFATTQSSQALGCETPQSAEFLSTSWGLNERNTRFQANSLITADNVKSLELAWVYALEGGQSPHSYPLVTQDTLYIGTQKGQLVALDRFNGCTRWRHQAPDSIRTGLVYGEVNNQAVIFFGTGNGEVEAIDALSGKPVWSIDARDHDAQFITGTPVHHNGTLFVPISSREVGLALSPLYGCCNSRGAIAAFDAATGKELWRTHSIAETPEITGRRWLFIETWGPSGAPVWSAPTIDTARNLLLFGSGENYSAPASAGSDAITALDLTTGERRWSQQYTAQDKYNMACEASTDHPNCPEDHGPDLDFGAPPILARYDSPNGPQEIILAGQKSADVHAIDPNSGVRLWSRNIGRGGYLGGVHWGMAANEDLGLLFAPVSDIRRAYRGSTDEPAPGMYAIDIATGEIRWQSPSEDRCKEREGCNNGYSAAPIANADLVFLAGLDGWLHALLGATGEPLWSVDTWRSYEAVNQSDTLTASGGSIDVHGPLLVEDQLFIQSGYGSFGQKGGNALLAFRLPDTKEQSNE